MDRNVLEHLSEEEIKELMELYYFSKMTVKEVMEKFNIVGITSGQLFKFFPDIVSKDQICEYCGVPLRKERLSKSAFDFQSRGYECPECLHSENEPCRCSKCEEKRRIIKEAALEKKREFVLKFLDVENPIDYSELTIKQKVYLGTFLRAGITQDYEKIVPINKFEEKISPFPEMDKEIFEELYDNKIIKIHLSAPINDFHENYEENILDFDYRKVPTYLNVSTKSERDVIIKELLNTSWNIEKENYIYIYDLWKKIIYFECLEIYKFRMENYNFEFKIGNKTEDFFESLIDQLPISQIYSVIWNGSKNSAAYFQEGRVSRRQASNSTLSRMRRTIDRIESGQWQVNDYNRPKECPQSSLSKYFFDSVIQICDKAWYTSPFLFEDEIKKMEIVDY